MKRITLCEVDAPTFLISESLMWHFYPTLSKVVEMRDTFYRIALNPTWYGEASMQRWLSEARELDGILERFQPEYVI